MSVELAAGYLSISQSMLRVHGPKPKRRGRRVLYDKHDLDRWADILGGGEVDLASAEDVEARFFARRGHASR